LPPQHAAEPPNRLLAGLPDRDRRQLLARCEKVELVLAAQLCVAGQPMRHVFFPTHSFISEIAQTDDRCSLEVGLVGDEGMLGLSLVLGVPAAPCRAQVQGAGSAWRIDAAGFRRELAASAALQLRLRRYAGVRQNELIQMVACTRFHLLEQRLARWLLTTRDRAHADQFDMTHEFLAHLLGVRRAGITRAAGVLQRRQLIDYRRGHITILDPQRLEARSCGCYRAARALYARMLQAPVR
jgi:CRP-like cAMP-binding protein